MSKNPQDLLGNEILVGSKVRVDLNGPFIIGTVHEIRNGGIATSDGKGVTPGVVVVRTEATVMFIPGGGGLNGVLCLRDPQSAKLISDVADAANVKAPAPVSPFRKS